MSATVLKISGLVVILSSCNLITEEFTLVYSTESPNSEFASKLEEVLEESYNVDIKLNPVNGASEIIADLESEAADMGLVENLVNEGQGVHTVVPVFPKVLHIFYRGEPAESFTSLFKKQSIYIGRPGTASYDFMMDLIDYFELNQDSIRIIDQMDSADVRAVFSIIMDQDELAKYDGYKLFSMDQKLNGEGSITAGIALKFPRVRPFVIPQTTYSDLTPTPIFTIATDMVYVVREGMGKVAVNDLTKSLFRHREQFVRVHPSFYFGIVEDFDRSRLSYSLHDGSKAYLNRDEPTFFERYAELAGVTFTILLALVSGLVSLGKRRRQKKKDKIDIFYSGLLELKNQTSGIKTITEARNLIQKIKIEQDRAFKMLIDEELEANESFRIYMQLSKEVLDEIKIKARTLKSAS